MKSQINKTIAIIAIFIAIGATTSTIFAQAVVSDPLLTGTVLSANEGEKKVLKDINNSHNKIAAMQTVIGANLKVMRSYEEKIYNYLSNVSDAVKQGFEIKQAAELTLDITKSFKSCAQAANKNPQGAIYTAIVAKKTSKLTQEMVGIYSYITNIALNKNTLLNSAERQMIVDNVLYKLRRIKSEMYLLQFQIEYYTLADLPAVLFPEQYFMAIDGKRIANKIISDYSK